MEYVCPLCNYRTLLRILAMAKGVPIRNLQFVLLLLEQPWVVFLAKCLQLVVGVCIHVVHVSCTEEYGEQERWGSGLT
jgi:hypothetical protein